MSDAGYIVGVDGFELVRVALRRWEDQLVVVNVFGTASPVGVPVAVAYFNGVAHYQGDDPTPPGTEFAVSIGATSLICVTSSFAAARMVPDDDADSGHALEILQAGVLLKVRVPVR